MQWVVKTVEKEADDELENLPIALDPVFVSKRGLLSTNIKYNALQIILSFYQVSGIQ